MFAFCHQDEDQIQGATESRRAIRQCSQVQAPDVFHAWECWRRDRSSRPATRRDWGDEVWAQPQVDCGWCYSAGNQGHASQVLTVATWSWLCVTTGIKHVIGQNVTWFYIFRSNYHHKYGQVKSYHVFKIILREFCLLKSIVFWVPCKCNFHKMLLNTYINTNAD